MNEMLALGDLSGFSDSEIKDHIAYNYNPQECGYPYASEAEALRKEIEPYKMLIAYESVGSWGCDSSSFFLMEKEGKLYEAHGSHCSCYGFEGQWDPEETSVESLERRNFKYEMGGYDDFSDENVRQITAYIAGLPKP